MLTCRIRRLGTQTTDLYIQFVRSELEANSLSDFEPVELVFEGGCRVRGTVRTSGSTPWLAPKPFTSNKEITKLLRGSGLEHDHDTRASFSRIEGTLDLPAARPGTARAPAPPRRDPPAPPQVPKAEVVRPSAATPVPLAHGSRSLDVPLLEQGIRIYWEEIDRRSPEVVRRERDFPSLATRYASRNPPHFDRADMLTILAWKHTDARWRQRAEKGLVELSDDDIRSQTARIQQLEDPDLALREFTGWAKGIGPATISAILAAARPDRWPVIDVFALEALVAYTQEPWLGRIPRTKDGRPLAGDKVWRDYVLTCRDVAAYATKASGKPWTARQVDMALWGLGKQLDGGSRGN